MIINAGCWKSLNDWRTKNNINSILHFSINVFCYLTNVGFSAISLLGTLGLVAHVGIVELK